MESTEKYSISGANAVRAGWFGWIKCTFCKPAAWVCDTDLANHLYFFHGITPPYWPPTVTWNEEK